MPSTLRDESSVPLRELPETAKSMARAHLRKAETVDYRAEIARLVLSVTGHLGLKEVAALIKQHTGRTIDERQLARWKDGSERPQFDALCAVPEFQVPIAVGFARIARMQVETVVRAVA